MLKQGFQKDIERIFEYINDHRKEKYQVLMFSATIPEWVISLSKKYQSADAEIFDMIKNSSSSIATSTTVNHYKFLCDQENR